jgi:phage minor structural protein, N-terminal domain protein|nr:MAG TPA: Neck appendage protein [Caudoviricetes sp.]
MIYLTEGNIPLNAAYDDDIVQEANSTYQLTFKFPTNNTLWQRLREETFLTADDLHGEQDFVIFEIEKKHGHIQVYANQVMTMLNHYVVNPISLDRVSGSAALSSFAGSITRDNPFSFFSDIDDRHTFNIDSKNAMEALTKDKHSILGLWGGDLVRHGYQVRLLKNGGSENESLFMYKKNLSSYEHKTSTKSLRTRITFITTIRGEGENPVDKHYKVVVDSPLINKYSQIYEDVVEVNDQDVKDEASLREYGKQYFRTTLCDMLEDSIEIDVVGHSDVPVQMFDVVGVYHGYYDLDVRKKITKYNYSPMAKKLKSIGFGEFNSGLASAIGNAVSDAVKSETQHLDGIFEAKLAKEIQNADLAFDRKKEELTNQFTDEVNAIKAKAEENKQALSDEINRRFHEFSPAGFEEAKTKAEEALKKAGAIPELQDRFESLNREKNEQGLKLYRMTNEFQLVKETAQLYERILGNTQNGISDNISRMVMTNQVFQTEVGKYSTQGGPNLLRNSRADDGLKYWNGAPDKFKFLEHQFYMNGQKRMFFLENGAVVGSPWFIFKRNADYTLNLTAFDANTARVRITLRKYKKDVNQEVVQTIFDKTGTPAFDSTKAVKKSFKFNTGDFDKGYLVFEYTGNPSGWSGMFMSELDFYEGSNDRKWQPAPEDSSEPIEAVRTQVTQLAGSWSVQNLNSAGDIIAGINIGANGNNRIVGKATHITGETLIDNAVIKSAMIDKLKTANFEAGSVTTNILGAEAVTAEKVKFDTAFIQRLVAQQAFVDELFSKKATITKIQSVDFTGSHIKGGVLTSLNGNSTFDLNAGQIRMQSGPTSWKTSWDANGLAFRGPGNDVWGAMGGDSGGGVGIYMRGDHAFNLVVNHSDYGPNYSYTALRVKYGEGTTLQFSPGGPSYNLLTLFRTIFNNFRYNESKYYDMK